MSYVRAVYRLAALLTVTAAGYIILLAGSLPLQASPNTLLRWRNLMVQAWARIVAVIIGMRIQARGAAPCEPSCLVSNHLSYLDIPLLLSQVGCVFVAKSELRSWPVLGFLMRSVGTVFVDRTNKKDVLRVNALIEKSIRQGCIVLLFPEGTTSAGNDVLPFKPSLLEYAAQTGLQVSFATIRYSTLEEDAPAHLSVCWWGDMSFAGHFFNLLKLRIIDASIEFGRTAVRHNDRKQLAQELRLHVKRLFVPITA